jgi:hypothetical protein
MRASTISGQHLPGASTELAGRELTILVPDGRDLVTSYVTDLAWAGVLAQRLEVIGPGPTDPAGDRRGGSARVVRVLTGGRGCGQSVQDHQRA